jgi:hypothetical protein
VHHYLDAETADRWTPFRNVSSVSLSSSAAWWRQVTDNLPDADEYTNLPSGVVLAVVAVATKSSPS